MTSNEPAEVIRLGPYRKLRATSRHAEALVAKLSAIPCEVHGRMTTAAAAVEKDVDGGLVTSIRHPPCCPAHAAALHVARMELEARLARETGLVDALLAEDAD